MTGYVGTALLAFLPLSELRGAIPFAIAQGFPWYAAYIFAAGVNALAAPCCWFFLSTVHGQLLRLSERRGSSAAALRLCVSLCRQYRAFFDGFVARARKKLQGPVERWGWLGVALFVAVPLPITGAWTGTLGAWVLGLPKGRTLGAAALGVCIAGALVTAALMLGLKTLDLFIKRV